MERWLVTRDTGRPGPGWGARAARLGSARTWAPWKYVAKYFTMPPRWFLWTLLALVSWGVWAILGKLIGDALLPVHSQALSTIGMVPVMIALAFSREPHPSPRVQQGAYMAFAAGIISSTGNIPYYYVLNSGAKAAAAVPVTALYPLITVILAVPLLRERLNRLQIGGIALSLVAIYLFNVPGEEGMFSAWLAVAMIPIFLWGLAGLLQKMCTNRISGSASSLCFQLAFVPVAGLLLWWQPIAVLPSTRTWGLVALLGLTLALGNLAVLRAFASGGKASIIAPLAGLYPLVSIPLAVLCLGERLGWRESLGALVALAAVAALTWQRGSELLDHPLPDAGSAP